MTTEKRLPNQCLPEFFEIIQAYGAYIRERNLVRESNKNFDVSESLSSELSGCRIDQYSYSYRENGADFGITKSEIGRIESTINHIINEEKALINIKDYRNYYDILTDYDFIDIGKIGEKIIENVDLDSKNKDKKYVVFNYNDEKRIGFSDFLFKSPNNNNNKQFVFNILKKKFIIKSAKYQFLLLP